MRYFMGPLLRLRPRLPWAASHRGRRSRAGVLDSFATRVQEFFPADSPPTCPAGFLADLPAALFARSSSGSVPSSAYAAQSGLRQGPATQTGTHAPSVL